MKAIFHTAVAVAILAGIFYFAGDISNFFAEIEEVKEEALEVALREATKTVLAPPPLRSETETIPNVVLTRQGIILSTNTARANEATLPPLKENARLNSAALAKTRDMLARQYFEHVSPIGRDVSDLAKDAGYEYILVGENLALGNFKSDAALVDGWMNSPGHRANILHERFTEIGVAAEEGWFEGRKVWLAVQIFGLPASACPAIDSSLEAQIESNNAELSARTEDLEIRRSELEAMRPKRGPEYNQKVDEYNALVEEYNALVQVTKTMVATYNAQVKAWNECANGETAN